VNQGITMISNVVQSTSATSEKTAVASKKLSRQSEMFKPQVRNFNLKKNIVLPDNNLPTEFLDEEESF
jgi:methyl-accepting chemotaxis protein